jgi:hypothetical protein
MSLQTLRDLRRAGSKPDGIVKVVVGKRTPADSRPDVVSVAAEDRPHLMDWRPLVGLPACLFVCKGADDLAERTYDAMTAAKCHSVGACWFDGPVSSDETTWQTLKRMWEVLCL